MESNKKKNDKQITDFLSMDLIKVTIIRVIVTICLDKQKETLSKQNLLLR